MATPWANWREVSIRPSAAAPGEYVVEGFDPRTNARYSRAVATASRKYLKIEDPGRPPAGRIGERRRLRLAYKELVVRFKPKVDTRRRDKILGALEFEVVAPSPYTINQWIVTHTGNEFLGQGLYVAAERLASLKDEVVFAWPNLVSEFRRASVPPLTRRWHLDAIRVNNIGGSEPGSRRVLKGSPDIIVAVLDDGVDLSHPNLVGRLFATPDPGEPLDRGGRDFTLMEDDAGHFDPSPKKAPVVGDPSRDYHGTACAGVAVSDGLKGKQFGVAPGCRFVAVKIQNGDELVPDTRVAAAIRYATRVADVITCSWTGAEHADVDAAFAEAANGRNGKGVPVFCATGNEQDTFVGHPASLDSTIAIGACTRTGKQWIDSNRGPELDLVAPSEGGPNGVFTTDPTGNTGWNAGNPNLGDALGLFWNNFGATSAATAMAAGVAALCLSVNPGLTSAAVQKLLQDNADRIGNDHDPITHWSPTFGFGQINAAKAVDAARDALDD